MNSNFALYSYYRSSASYRVRIALHLKGIPFEYRPIHLLKNGGEQYSPEYKRLNPMSQVPCLIHNDRPIGQSMAIFEYLDNITQQPRLFPLDPFDRAMVIQICEAFNSGIQPLQNTSVTAALENTYGFTSAQKTEWIQHWNHKGLTGVEELLRKTAGEFCLGDTVTAADCFLVPQVYSAKRFNVDLTAYPHIRRIDEAANRLEAFQLAEPSRQPDFQK
jgi:maleylacetoacetate isomerase